MAHCGLRARRTGNVFPRIRSVLGPKDEVADSIPTASMTEGEMLQEVLRLLRAEEVPTLATDSVAKGKIELEVEGVVVARDSTAS